MTVVEMRSELSMNGLHDNATYPELVPVPEGWALLPESIRTQDEDTIKYFPYGEIMTEKRDRNHIPDGYTIEIYGDRDEIDVVTSWTPIPQPEPVIPPTPPEPVEDDTTIQDLEDALIELETATNERLDAIEEALCELDLEAQA